MHPELQRFVGFHEANPQVYDFFKYFTRVAIQNGHDKLSPWLVMNRVRWETDIVTKSADGFKISNNHFAYYSRMYMYDHPGYKGFFRTNQMANEHEIMHWLDRSRGKHKPMQHSPLGASAAHRWMPCPGSVAAEKDYPRDTNKYAAQGTAAHEIAEKCLGNGKDAHFYATKKVKVEGMTFEVDGEMVRGVQLYLDVVREDKAYLKAPKIYVENKVDLSKVHPGMFGTNDAALMTPKKLNVYDLKYGRGVVQAEDNPQLLYYALGALLAMDPKKKVEEIEMVIIQPRVADPVKRWTVSRQYLKDWAKELRAAAIATEQEDAPRLPGEKQCEWCKHRGACKELENMALEKAMVEFDDDGNIELPDVEDMGDNVLAEVLRWSPFIKTYLNAIESKALKMLEAGEKVDGYKLVAKRPVRKWADPNATVKGLAELGLDDDDIYKEPVLLSPAQMEKLLTKDQREEMADLVTSESSGHKMVLDSDPADEVSAGTVSDFADD